MALTREQVIAALRTVQDPELFKDIVTLNMVKDVRVDGQNVNVTVELTTPACPLKDVIERDVTNALQRIGAETVKLNLTANTRGPASQRNGRNHSPPRGGVPMVEHEQRWRGGRCLADVHH